jgi:hypothetical protein
VWSTNIRERISSPSKNKGISSLSRQPSSSSDVDNVSVQPTKRRVFSFRKVTPFLGLFLFLSIGRLLFRETAEKEFDVHANGGTSSATAINSAGNMNKGETEYDHLQKRESVVKKEIESPEKQLNSGVQQGNNTSTSPNGHMETRAPDGVKQQETVSSSPAGKATKKPTFVLHVGLHKTGTTFVQGALCK